MDSQIYKTSRWIMWIAILLCIGNGLSMIQPPFGAGTAVDGVLMVAMAYIASKESRRSRD